MRHHAMFAVLFVLAGAGCTSVKPTPEGEKVHPKWNRSAQV